jgi:hypothetical protein
MNAHEDNVLSLIIKLAESAETGTQDRSGIFEITLNVEGAIITGSIISYDMYMSLLQGGIWRDAYEKAGGLLEELDPHSSKYIHLASARYIPTNGCALKLTGEGIIWRGKLERVNGFSIGRMQVASVEAQVDNQQ